MAVSLMQIMLKTIKSMNLEYIKVYTDRLSNIVGQKGLSDENGKEMEILGFYNCIVPALSDRLREIC